MQRRTTALYFSPTGGTRTYVRAVAAAMPHMGGEVDLTRPEERRKVHMFGADDVVVLGVPVYYGRVPEVPGLLDGLQGEETPAVLLAVYGNRPGVPPSGGGGLCSASHIFRQGSHGATQRRGSGGGRGAGTPGGGEAVGALVRPGIAREPALPQLSEGAVLPSGGRYLHPLRLLCRGLPGGGHPSCRAPCDRR